MLNHSLQVYKVLLKLVLVVYNYSDLDDKIFQLFLPTLPLILELREFSEMSFALLRSVAFLEQLEDHLLASDIWNEFNGDDTGST